MSVVPPFAPCGLPRWLTAVVLAVATLAFLPTLTGGFLADDFVYVARFYSLPWSEWPGLFVREWSGGAWGQPLREVRPFAALSFLGDARLFGVNPVGYHLSNLALHLLATFFVTRLAALYTNHNRAAALIAGLVFALHPAHVEAVAWITGRVDLLATTAALLFWLAAEFYSAGGRRAHLVIALFVFFIGVFAKEFCSFVPPLLLLNWLLLDLRASRPVWLRRAALLAGSVALVIVYALCRRAALGHDSIGYNMWADVPAWQRQASYLGWLLPLLPFTPHPEWQSFSSIGVHHAVWIAFTAATLLGLVVALRRRARVAVAALFFGGVWFLLTVTPLTGVVYHSPRHLYFPSVGFALAAGIAFSTTRASRLLGVLLVAWCAAAHVAALLPWRSAGLASREALRVLDRTLSKAGPGAVAITSAPARFGPAWMWAWSNPPALDRPFLAHPPASSLENPVSYSRSGAWADIRRPVETIRAASALVVLHIDTSGNISCRRLPPAELPAAAESLTQAAAGGLSPEAWDAWVLSLAKR